MTTHARSAERLEFLGFCFTGAIENFGYGSFYVNEYRWDGLPESKWFAEIECYDGMGTHRIDLDTIAHGIAVISNSTLQEVKDGKDAGTRVLHNAETGERLYLSGDRKKEIMLASRTNGDEGDLDVVDYLAILECGIFGKVVYA